MPWGLIGNAVFRALFFNAVTTSSMLSAMARLSRPAQGWQQHNRFAPRKCFSAAHLPVPPLAAKSNLDAGERGALLTPPGGHDRTCVEGQEGSKAGCWRKCKAGCQDGTLQRGQTGRSWVRKSGQEDVPCSLPLGSDSDVALLPYTQ